MKRKITIVLIVFLFIALIPINARAYDNSYYYNHQNINIGLTSMASSMITVTLNGDYSINNTSYKTGTSLILKKSGSQIELNSVLYDEINFVPNQSTSTLTLQSGTLKYSYLGVMKFKVLSDNLIPINSLNIEDYLKGVVPYEMSDSFPLEALKVQAVAARSYGLFHIGKHGTSYDLCDTTDCQVYKGYNPSYSRTILAVDTTKGQVMLYGSSLVEALYSSSNGGYVEDAQNVWGNKVDYLTSKPDSFDNELWPNGDRVFSNIQIDTSLKAKGYILLTDTFLSLDLNSITKYISGRVSNINIIYKDATGALKTKSLQRDNCRNFLSLPSGMYNVIYNSALGSYTFSGKGYGHGLGMSQIGAKNRANAGQLYTDILQFYYTGSFINSSLAKIASFNKSIENIYVNDYVNFTAKPQFGSGQGYLYKYIIEKNGAAVFTQDFSEVDFINYKFKEQGDYTIHAYIKDKLSNSSYDDSKDYNYTVKFAGEGDINVDGVVDIYDLTSISKNLGKTRDNLSNWNERCNLIDSDNVIDMLDIAKAAQNYNKRY